MAIEPAQASDRATLAHLLQLYFHDFSEYFGDLPGDDGRFAVGPRDPFEPSAGRHPFLIRSEAGLAGFALLSQGSVVSGARDVMDMTEFFVVRGARRRGVGRMAACALFAMFPGSWEVRVMQANERALLFWSSCIDSFTSSRFELGEWNAPSGRRFVVLRFQSARPGSDRAL